jgi:hypothetical protein
MKNNTTSKGIPGKPMIRMQEVFENLKPIPKLHSNSLEDESKKSSPDKDKDDSDQTN